MDAPSSALISYPFDESPTTSQRGNSGVFLAEGWVLTHGSLLDCAANKGCIMDRLSGTKTGELIVVPEKMRFSIFYDTSKSNSKSNVRQALDVQEATGQVVALWRCPLLKETFDEFFETWDFNDAKRDRLLLSVFVVIRLGVGEPVKVEEVRRVLAGFEKTLGKVTKGSLIEIESTPFGNPVFIDSVARGIVSNVVGNEECVIMTDANAFPGCEGGPVYVVTNCGRRILCGMVIAPLSWCRGEWVDYTIVANLPSCLRRVLQEESFNAILRGDVQGLGSNGLDNCIVVIRCGSSWGTGIFVDRRTGTFLTCSHVVCDAPEGEIRVVLPKGEGNLSAWAKLVYRTPGNKPYDVAVLRVNPEDLDPSLRPIKLADGPVVKGEPVVSTGFPFFSSRPTASAGIVSKSLDCMLQTTCCVQSGASGGPIVRSGTDEMIGMVVCNTMSSCGSVLYPRLSMAIPVSVLRRPLMDYLASGNRKDLEALTSKDVIVRQIWSLHGSLLSKM